MQVYVAIARYVDDPEDSVLQVGATPGMATAALDGLMEFMYEAWCSGVEQANCGSLESFRNRYVFTEPEEFKVHGDTPHE